MNYTTEKPFGEEGTTQVSENSENVMTTQSASNGGIVEKATEYYNENKTAINMTLVIMLVTGGILYFNKKRNPKKM